MRMGELSQAAWRRIEAHWSTEVSSRSLGIMRVFLTYMIYAQFASPWVSHRVDDNPGVLLMTWAVFISAAFVMIGFKTRVATAVMATAFAVLHLYYGVVLGLSPSYEVDPGQVVGAREFAWEVQEFQLVLLLALTPSGRSLSIDRALEVRRARAEGREPAPERIPWWQLELFVIHAAAMYLWIGHDSLRDSWISGAQFGHDFIWYWSFSDLFAYAPWTETAVVVVAWVVMLSCFALGIGLLSRRLRPKLMWIAVALQFVVLFNFVDSWATEAHNLLMLGTLIACLDPQRVHSFVALQGLEPPPPPPPSPRPKNWLEAIALTQISSRLLGLFRIFAALTIILEFTSTWAGHRLDGHLGSLLLGWVMLSSAWFVLFGYKTRWFAIALAVSVAILNYYYGVHMEYHVLRKPIQMVQVVVLLALTPCGRSLSFDRAIEVRRARAAGREPAPEIMPWWQVELFILVMATIYFWAALHKTDAQWLNGERMERYWLEWYGGSDSFVYSSLVHPIAVFLSWSTTILEFVLAFTLLSRRTRPYAMWGGVMLHVGILFAFSVTYFSLKSLLLLGLCLPPKVIHDFIERITFTPPSQADQSSGSG